MTFEELVTLHCVPHNGPADALAQEQLAELLTMLPDWEQVNEGKAIAKDFRFKNFHHTLGFINAVGYMANREDHHPDIEAGYGHCRVLWSTHDVGGLSLNDMICAARVEALLR